MTRDPWSYQSWGWHSNCWIVRSVHSHSGSTSRYACVARSPGVKLCVYVVERLRSQICRCFMLGILARHIGTFLSCLVTGYPRRIGSLKQGFLRKFSWPSLNPDVPQSSTVVYLEVHPNHVVRIKSLELEAASDWQDWELESTTTKYGRQPRTVLEFSSNSYQFKTSPFTTKPSQTTR